VAIAARLRADGATVTVTARSLPADYPEPQRFIAADTSTVDGARTVVDQITAAGGVDILVHVVGGSHAPAGGFAALSEQDWIPPNSTSTCWARSVWTEDCSRR
jgi:NAD(P)-dependent dehydrogenase (short-subunit alcohol dehydrogenase family)